ncbi:YrhB domain-containing protein [Streptomyces purpureus]|uniref:YrhB domain-containing protein n=1 Tax=Streptomyces purpureus TaxID=1951 RepID=UPI00379A8E12
MNLDPQQQALQWLRSTYHGLVELAAPGPVAEDAHTWLFACRAVEQPGYPATPMLASSVVVPKNGMTPFHPAAPDPWGDVAAFGRSPAPREYGTQARVLNSRGCVVTVAAALGGGPSSTLPWSPAHEGPGWWELLLRRYFPAARPLTCRSWEELIAAARETGPGTRGVVWVRREIAGYEASGHLLYVDNNGGQVVILDGMTGGLARLETQGIRELVFARTAPRAAVEPEPWLRAATDLRTAVEKAGAWLHRTYDDPVVLVDPSPADENRRGWLFACQSQEFLRGGDWTRAMLDGAVVVPKAHGEPFGLPNSYPWPWLAAWEQGGTPGEAGMPLPPRPGSAVWFPTTMAQLGQVLSVSEHSAWDTLLDELSAFPVGARALIWARRRDGQGRESVGLLLTGFRSEQGTGVVDGSAAPLTDLNAVAASGFRLIRYR